MNTRKDNKGKALAAWKALGVGHIAKPLRHIRNRCARRNERGQIVYAYPYPLAEVFARMGQGDCVQDIAMTLHKRQ